MGIDVELIVHDAAGLDLDALYAIGGVCAVREFGATNYKKLTGIAPDRLIAIDCRERYFGPDYPRGRWPLIRETICAVRAAVGERKIEYGGDYGVEFDEVDDELLAIFDGLWNAYVCDDAAAFRAGMLEAEQHWYRHWHS